MTPQRQMPRDPYWAERQRQAASERQAQDLKDLAHQGYMGKNE